MPRVCLRNQFWSLPLSRKGSGFVSIHPSDEFTPASFVLSGAAHEAAAGHAFPWPMASELSRTITADNHSLPQYEDIFSYRIFDTPAVLS